MKDESLWVVFGLSYIALWLIILFAIWGGNPEGVYWKVERYQKEQQAEIQSIKASLQKIEAKKWHR